MLQSVEYFIREPDAPNSNSKMAYFRVQKRRLQRIKHVGEWSGVELCMLAVLESSSRLSCSDAESVLFLALDVALLFCLDYCPTAKALFSSSTLCRQATTAYSNPTPSHRPI